MTVSIWDPQSTNELHQRLRLAAPGAVDVLEDAAAWEAISTAFLAWVAGRDLTAERVLQVFASDLFGVSRGKGKRIEGLVDQIDRLRGDVWTLGEKAGAIATGFAMSEERRVRLAALATLQRLHDAAVALDEAAEALATLDQLSTGLSGGRGSMNAKAAPTFLSVAQATTRAWCGTGSTFPGGNLPDGGLQDLLKALHVEGTGAPLANPQKMMGQLRKWRKSSFRNFPP